MEKIKIIQEAFEKAKELYWEEGKAICVSVELWKYSDGHERERVKLWVDEDARSVTGGKSSHISDSESFQELLDFLGIEESPLKKLHINVGEALGRPDFTHGGETIDG